MRYIKVKFTKGLKGVAFQEVDDYGEVTRYVDLTSETLELPGVIECSVVAKESEDKKDWGSAPDSIAKHEVSDPLDYIVGQR